MRDMSGDIQGQRVHVEGGGRCIYCGADGGPEGLHDEHIMPFSLGGNTVLLAASCSACEKITSYLDGYLANATYKHFRVHSAIRSRSGHPNVLPAVVEINGAERAFDLAPSQHPYFQKMPIWDPPGLMCGLPPSPDFGPQKVHLYWYVPPDFRETIDLRTGDLARIIDQSPLPNLPTFARAIAKVAYCHAVYMFGLGGFRSLAPERTAPSAPRR
jgi:HNH endonuclease